MPPINPGTQHPIPAEQWPEQAEAVRPVPLVSQLYPSPYLHAVDLKGQPQVVVIAGVAEVPVKETKKLAVYLASIDKPLVLNKTNARAIAALHGDDPNSWTHQRLELYPTKTELNGEMVDCIRIRPALEAPGLEKGTPQ